MAKDRHMDRGYARIYLSELRTLRELDAGGLRSNRINERGEVVACLPSEGPGFWGAGFRGRVVRRSHYANSMISTVLLAFYAEGPALETMIFTRHGVPNPFSDYQRRYFTKAEAVAGHEEALAEVVAHYEQR